jgi:pimeloyl-ACP methyl ester carboxylesterase
MEQAGKARRRLAARVVFYAAVVGVAIPAAFSQQMVGTLRQPSLPPPAGFEETRLTVDGLKLRALVLRGDPSRPAAVVAHGLGDSLDSFVDVAQELQRLGFTALLFDFRGHGGSEGRHTTLGGREREDVRAAMSWLGTRGLASKGFVLMGCSMGAVAALRAAAGRDDVRAVVAEAPFDSYRSTIAHHAKLLYHIPSWMPLIPVAIAVAEWRAGFDADEVDAVAAARDVRAPLLAIVDGDDPRMPERVVRRVLDAHPGPKRLWVAPGVGHCGAAGLHDYWPAVRGFFAESGL